MGEGHELGTWGRGTWGWGGIGRGGGTKGGRAFGPGCPYGTSAVLALTGLRPISPCAKVAPDLDPLL